MALLEILRRFRGAWLAAALLLAHPPLSSSAPLVLDPRTLSEATRARLAQSAADPALLPWQRHLMLEISAPSEAAAPLPLAATRVASGPDDGEWTEVARIIGASGPTAVYDPPRHRMLVFGGYDGFAYSNEVWALSLDPKASWSRLSPLGGPPGPRAIHTAIYDPPRDRMIVFGGFNGYVTLNDMWALELSSTPQWTQLSPLGTAPGRRSGHAATYDPLGDRMLIFGGWDGGQGRNDAWALSLAGPVSWSPILASGSFPDPRYNHGVIYDAPRNRMLLFGGYDTRTRLYRNDVWALTLGDSPEWMELLPSGDPPAGRYRHKMAYDPERDHMLVFGGYDGTAVRNDAWLLDLSGDPTWQLVTPEGAAPVPRFGHTAIYDSAGERMVVFAGSDGLHALGDAWALTLREAPTWVRVGPVAAVPVPRQQHAVAYDPHRRRMLMFGGFDDVYFHNDLWALGLGGVPEWTELSPLGDPPSPRYGHSAVYDPMRDRLVVFGGYDGTQLLNDVWILTLSGTPTWSPLYVQGTPPSGRFGASAIYDPVRDRVLIFGGLDAQDARNDLWELRLSWDPRWTEIEPTETWPGSRYVHSAIYDPVRRRMVVFGGYDLVNLLVDSWELSLQEPPAWRLLAPSGIGPTGCAEHAAIFDSRRDRMVIFGGFNGFYLADVWSMSLGDPEAWVRLTPTGAWPPPRHSPKAIYDPVRDRMVVFGGAATVSRNDVWLLSWSSVVDVAPSSAAADFSLAPSEPNPSRGPVSIRYSVPRWAQVSLRVYDLEGRVVHTLLDETVAPGEHVVRWEGRDARGTLVRSGVYLCELRSGAVRRARRMVLLR